MKFGSLKNGLSLDKSLSSTICYLYATVIILITTYSRLRLLSAPLERDEGEFAYIGQQILRGIPPFESGFSTKFPGIHAAYALIMAIFGESAGSIHFGLLLINLGSIFILFRLAQKVMPSEGAAVTAGTYAILSTSMKVLGVFAHATHFVIFFALAGIYILIKGFDGEKSAPFLISGLCLGLSSTMKQNGIFFCLFAVCCLLIKMIHAPKKQTFTRLTLLTLGMAAPFLAVFACYLFFFGNFDALWFWTISYAWVYATEGEFLSTLKQLISRIPVICATTWLFYLLAVTGLVLFFRNKREVNLWLTLPGFLATSFFAMLPGSYFYEHYFILFSPALALYVGWTITALPESGQKPGTPSLARWVYLAVLLTAASTFLYKERSYLFSLNGAQVSTLLYEGNPFNESIVIADYIKKNTPPGTPITVLGSEPQIYFYADRPSVSRHLTMYSLTMGHPFATYLQKEMIKEIETAAPEYIILADIPTSWLFDKSSNTNIVEWANRFLAERYKEVGLVVITHKTSYYWGNTTKTIVPPGGRSLSIYRKLGSRN